MKKVKEPAPHEKAAQIEKEAVRALSVDEVEEALTKSTFAGMKKLEPLDEDDNIIKDIEAENNGLRRDNNNLLIEYFGLKEENEKLRETIKELRNVRTGMAECNKDIEVLKTECLDLKEEKNRLLREIDDYKKTISKMKYAHEEEVRALEDDLAESKILNKKAGEYSSMLDADSDAFETILELAKVIHGLAKSTESISLLIKDEVEGHV